MVTDMSPCLPQKLHIWRNLSHNMAIIYRSRFVIQPPV
uniref:Uncharacterized protein n=1 Tax=Anguilla anguilla TaxID=7936 RepID=A0A0E9SWN5_ANGAN